MQRLVTLSQYQRQPASGIGMAGIRVLMLAIFLKRLLLACSLLATNTLLTALVPLCHQEVLLAIA